MNAKGKSRVANARVVALLVHFVRRTKRPQDSVSQCQASKVRWDYSHERESNMVPRFLRYKIKRLIRDGSYHRRGSGLRAKPAYLVTPFGVIRHHFEVNCHHQLSSS